MVQSVMMLRVKYELKAHAIYLGPLSSWKSHRMNVSALDSVRGVRERRSLLKCGQDFAVEGRFFIPTSVAPGCNSQVFC